MQRKVVYGKWQKRVQKVLLKRHLQEGKKESGDAAAKTVKQQEIPLENTKQG